MKIEKFFGTEGAKKAKGIVIIVDIFRAATLAAYILHNKAKYIIPVTSKEEALFLKSKKKNYILVGEEGGYRIDGFDFGNSPYEISNIDFENKIIVHRSSQGTQGIIHAISADKIIFGSFLVTSSIVKYIKDKNFEVLSIVVMDGKGSEDDIFADYLIERLRGNRPDFSKIKEKILNLPSSQRFLDESISQFPKEDIKFCLELDKFNFVPLIKIIDDKPVLKKIQI